MSVGLRNRRLGVRIPPRILCPRSSIGRVWLSEGQGWRFDSARGYYRTRVTALLLGRFFTPIPRNLTNNFIHSTWDIGSSKRPGLLTHESDDVEPKASHIILKSRHELQEGQLSFHSWIVHVLVAQPEECPFPKGDVESSSLSEDTAGRRNGNSPGSYPGDTMFNSWARYQRSVDKRLSQWLHKPPFVGSSPTRATVEW
jgi:hypothetical protein